MKLRVQENSLRLRLSRSEVASFASTGRLECSLSFGDSGALRYAIEADDKTLEPRAIWAEGLIRVLIPMAAVREWAETERIGIEGTRSGVPQILVEKDFQCLHREGGESDAYPNPLSGD